MFGLHTQASGTMRLVHCVGCQRLVSMLFVAVLITPFLYENFSLLVLIVITITIVILHHSKLIGHCVMKTIQLVRVLMAYY